MNTVFCLYDFQCPHGTMIHAVVGDYELLLMWLFHYMYCAICSLQLYSVINVHTVHSVPLLMWLIYIKSFPISQSPTVVSYRDELQRVLLLLFINTHMHTHVQMHTNTTSFFLQYELLLGSQGKHVETFNNSCSLSHQLPKLPACAFGLWEEPEENPRSHGYDTQTEPSKAPDWTWIQDLVAVRWRS